MQRTREVWGRSPSREDILEQRIQFRRLTRPGDNQCPALWRQMLGIVFAQLIGRDRGDALLGARAAERPGVRMVGTKDHRGQNAQSKIERTQPLTVYQRQTIRAYSLKIFRAELGIRKHMGIHRERVGEIRGKGRHSNHRSVRGNTAVKHSAERFLYYAEPRRTHPKGALADHRHRKAGKPASLTRIRSKTAVEDKSHLDDGRPGALSNEHFQSVIENEPGWIAWPIVRGHIRDRWRIRTRRHRLSRSLAGKPSKNRIVSQFELQRVAL